MFKKLIIQNFKSWKRAEVTFGSITGFFGTNSSGKSSLLQFILMLKQTREASDRNTSLDLNGAYVELGTVEDIIYNHDTQNKLGFTLEYQSASPLQIRDSSKSSQAPFINGKNMILSAVHTISENEAQSDSLEYGVEDFSVSLDRVEERGGKYRLKTNADEEMFRFIRSPGRAWQLPSPMKTYQFPDQARTYYQNASFLADFELKLEEKLDQTYYLGPLREYPRRDYLWARSRPSDVGKKGEKAIDAILAATAQGETRNLKAKAHHKPFEEMIAYWLKQLGLIEDFRIVEIAHGSNRWQAKIKTVPGGPEVLLTDVGFGVSQIIPVLTLLYYVPEGSTVILEQPEIHLHPLAQAELADAIINVSTHRKIQVILESHSEHLLLRLQRRIAEAVLPSKDVKLYFCNRGQDYSTITDLEIDMFGGITNWPQKFMGDAFEETAKAELARLKRMQSKAAE